MKKSPSFSLVVLDWTLLIALVLGSFFFVAWLPLGFVLPKLVIFNVFGLFALGVFLFGSSNFSVIWNNWIGRAIAAYFVVLLLYMHFSFAFETSLLGEPPVLQGLTTLVIYFVFFMFGIGLMKYPVKAIVAANVAVVIYGIFQLIGFDRFESIWIEETFLGRTFSSLGNPNFLGSFLVLTIPFVWMARKHFRWSGVLLLMDVVILFSTASRGALVALGFMLILFCYQAHCSAVSRMTRRSKVTFAIILLALFLFGLIEFGHRYATEFQLGRSANARFVIWEDTIELIKEQPWGYGLETFSILYPHVQSAALYEYESFTMSVDRAHNLILDLWIAAGPIAVILFFGFLIALFLKGWKREETFFPALALIGYVVSLMFSFETVVTGVIFWLVAGALLRGVMKSSRGEWRLPSAILSVSMMIALLISLFINMCHLRSEVNYAYAEAFLTNNDIPHALEFYAESIQPYPYDRIHLLKATEVALVTLQMNLTPESVDSLEAFVESNLASLDTLTGGRDASTVLLEAWYLAYQGDLYGFEEKLAAAKTMAPHHVSTFWVAARIYEVLGDEMRMLQEYASIEALMPSYLLEDPEGDAARIFWKENIWLDKDYLQSY